MPAEPRQVRTEPRQVRTEPRDYLTEPREYLTEPGLAGRGARDRIRYDETSSQAAQYDVGGARPAGEPGMREPGMRSPGLDNLEPRQDQPAREDYLREPDGYRVGRTRPEDRRPDPGSEPAPARARPGAESLRRPGGYRGRGPDEHGHEDGYGYRDENRGPDSYRGPDEYRRQDRYGYPDGHRSPDERGRQDSYGNADGHRGRDGDGGPAAYGPQDGYRGPDERRHQDGYRSRDGYRGPGRGDYRGSDRDPDEYRADGYQDPGGYRGPRSDRGPDGGRAPDGYRNSDDTQRGYGYRSPVGYRGPDAHRGPAASHLDSPVLPDGRGGADRRYLADGQGLDGYRPDSRRPDGSPPGDRRLPEGGGWRPENYGESALPGSQVDERDVYVVTDLPERRSSGYRPGYEAEPRDRDANGARDDLRDGARGQRHDGFGPPGVLRPDGLPPEGAIRLGASHAERGGNGHEQLPGIERTDSGDPPANGVLRPARQDAPRTPGAPLELSAGSPDVPPGDEGDPVPLMRQTVREPAAAWNRRNEDEERTSPLPVILPGATSVPRPEPVLAPRGPFEAARPGRAPSVTGSVEPPPAANAVVGPTAALAPLPPMPQSAGLAPSAGTPPSPVPELPPHAVPEAASAKLDQLKDLYFAAEAIGEERLGKNFDQVSQRQRELIREFFERSKPAG